MPMPQMGETAPQFDLVDQDGRNHKLSDYAGKNVVLYFYPKDDTPGCTVEACAFRDDHSKLEAAGAVVLGVSPDNTKSHRKFVDKYSLNFPLLSDTEHAIAEAYGAWGEKENYGRKYMGIIRSTFLIGPDGKISRVWPKVKVQGHSEEVLSAITGQPVESKQDSGKKTASAAKKVSAMVATAAAPVAQKAVEKVKAAAKKVAPKNAAAKKSAAKNAAATKPTKKASAKNAAATKASAKHGSAKRAAKVKGAAKKAAAKDTSAKKPTAKKAPAKKAVAKLVAKVKGAVKKVAAKAKATAKKTAAKKPARKK